MIALRDPGDEHEERAYARANAAEARVKELEARLVEAGDAARVLIMHLQVSGFPSGVSTVRILAERVESLLAEIGGEG